MGDIEGLYTNTTEKELAKEATEIQNACNLSGVAHALSRAITKIHGIYGDRGTDFINHHPIVQLYVAKLADLCGIDYTWPRAADEEIYNIIHQKQ